MFLPRLLPFDQTPSGESRPAGPANAGEEIAHARFGDHRILVLAERLLKLLRPRDERTADDGCFARIPCALDADPCLVQLLVSRIVTESIDGLTEALVLALGRPAKGLSLAECRRVRERGAQLGEPG